MPFLLILFFKEKEKYTKSSMVLNGDKDAKPDHLHQSKNKQTIKNQEL